MDFNKELEKEIIEFHKTGDIDHYENILNLLPYCILRTPTYLVEQILEINENGEVNFKAYKYNGENKKLTLAREENLTIIKGLIKEILDLVSGLFSHE